MYGTFLAATDYVQKHLESKSDEISRYWKSLILVCAYNEERSLPLLLQSLKGREVLVVDDGSLDGTRSIVLKSGAMLLSHEKRCGKAAALADGISFALQNQYDFVIEIGADALPDSGAVDETLRLLKTNDVGAVSCRQIPVGEHGVSYYIDELIWSVLAKGKRVQMERSGSSHLGAVMFGYKPELIESVEGSVNDDEVVGISISRKGYRSLFSEKAIVFFDASSCLGHILERRRRMYFGHMKFTCSSAPSMQFRTLTVAIFRALSERPARAMWLIPAAMLDLTARLLAWADSKNPRKQHMYSRWVTTYRKDNSLVIRNRLH